MKIIGIKCAGFRGMRREISLALPGGFVVVVGRNGAGKSSICDAVEYALTGTIRTTSSHHEKGEEISDYMWWRGQGVPSGRYVELTLVDHESRQVSIRRTPTQLEVSGGKSIEEVLCDPTAGIDEPVVQLCRTAILRDEDITRLSVDMLETERFDFVRASLGTADFTSAEERAKKVQALLEDQKEDAERLYYLATDLVAGLTSQLSHARTEIADADDVGAAQARLRQFLNDSALTPEQLVTVATRRTADVRVATDGLVRLLARLEDSDRKLQAVKEPAQALRSAELVRKCKDLQHQVESAEADLKQAEIDLGAAQRKNPTTASLALLKEHGGRLGLLNGACPLCASAQSDERFRVQLEQLTNRIAATSAEATATARRAAESASRLVALKTECRRCTSELETLQNAERDMRSLREGLYGEAQALGVDLVGQERDAAGVVASRITANRAELTDVERALSAVNASRAVERLRGLELAVSAARERVGATEKRLSQSRAAGDQIREALATIRRVQGEYVNEQLAQLEPLMLEVYQRLRPHIDWPEVRYRLRGDVRRMLSLEIGEGVNPSFMFSSGQRRAAGLSFLLAVHLSRRWCRLDTLILDDPVQHIDDYRALHLVEVLGAIRRTGRQVVCTVEDESLGNLLARRLRSDADEPGVIVTMSYSSQAGTHVASVQHVVPMPKSILVPA